MSPSICESIDSQSGANVGTHHVQVLRTLVCEGVYPFAPDGGQTLRLAYEKAIDRAQHYVYIEDQYFLAVHDC